MKSARLNRLFNPKSGRCFDVAIDHGFFNEFDFLSGIEDIGKAVATLVEAAPDAIQLTIGQAPVLQAIPGRKKPSLVLRTDVANVYGRELPKALFSPHDQRAGRAGAAPRRHLRRGQPVPHPRASPRSPTSAFKTSSRSSRTATASACRS